MQKTWSRVDGEKDFPLRRRDGLGGGLAVKFSLHAVRKVAVLQLSKYALRAWVKLMLPRQICRPRNEDAVKEGVEGKGKQYKI